MNSDDIIDYCRKNGARLVFDLDVDYIKDGNEERFKQLDIAFFNEVGFDSYRGPLDEQAAAQRLLSLGVELVVVTMAARGCVIYTQSETIQSPAHDVEVVDVTGAGDTFCSSFLFALSRDKGIRYAAEFANAAASICVGKLGARAGAVSQEEVEKVMRS